MVLEKSELPSCSTVQSCHPKWVPEDPIYKIGPPRVVHPLLHSVLLYQPIKESLLHWRDHWSCSVLKT